MPNDFRARSIIGTINLANEPEEQQQSRFDKLTALSRADRIRSMRVAREHWTGGGTRHFQFAIFFKASTKITDAFKLRWGLNGAHIQGIKDPIRAWQYINKEGQTDTPHNADWGEELVIDVGEGPTQGKRTDLTAVAEALREGSSPSDIAHNHTEQSIKFSNGIERTYALLNSDPRSLDRMPRVLTLVGPTGTGKSQRSHNYCSDQDDRAYVWTAALGNFWEQYYGQKLITMEEFRGQMPRAEFLKLIDKYPMTVNKKNSSAQMRGETFIITSPTLPSDWYEWGEDTDKKEQLFRRLTENTESRIFHTEWKQFIDGNGSILADQPEWGHWNYEQAMTRDDPS